MEKKELLKMNLQHFAEPTQESPKDEPKPPAQEPPKDQLSDNPGSRSDEPQPSLEEQLQQMRIENAKLKKAQEDAATDASNYEKNFLTLGYSQELAKKAAEAQFEGDTDTLFLVQSQVQEAIVKAKEAEWYKNRPEITTGAGDGSKDDPFLQGFNS